MGNIDSVNAYIPDQTGSNTDLIRVEIRIDCQDWGGEPELRAIVIAGIGAVVDVVAIPIPEDAELSILFSDDIALRELNRQFREIDKPTNVLSFPTYQIRPGERPDRVLGDLALGYQTVHEEAERDNISLENHLSHLVVHGLLHLFGYDHELDKDAEVMESLEIAALKKLGINNPYLQD